MAVVCDLDGPRLGELECGDREGCGRSRKAIDAQRLVPADQPLIGLGIAKARRPQKRAWVAGDPIPRAPARGTHPGSNVHAHGSET
jgi:hypothetical protein